MTNLQRLLLEGMVDGKPTGLIDARDLHDALVGLHIGGYVSREYRTLVTGGEFPDYTITPEGLAAVK